jgi:hypothetical protein
MSDDSERAPSVPASKGEMLAQPVVADDLFDRLGRRLEGLECRWGRLGTAGLVALATQLLSLLLYGPVIAIVPMRLMQSYAPMCEQPFGKIAMGEPQVRHRILAPVIAYSLGLRGPSGLLVPVAANTLLLAGTYLLLRRQAPPKVALQAAVLLSTTLVVITSQTWWGYPDALGHLAVLLGMATPSPVLIGLSLYFGMLGDERCAAAVPLLLFWHFRESYSASRWTRLVLQALASGLAVALWGLTYFWLKQHFQIAPYPPEVVGLRLAIRQIGAIPAGAYFALRSAWALPILLTVSWLWERPLTALVFLLTVVLAVIPGTVVQDTSRSMAFAYPAIFIALAEMNRRDRERASQPLRVAIFLNLFTPQYQVVAKTLWGVWPLPLALLVWYLGL